MLSPARALRRQRDRRHRGPAARPHQERRGPRPDRAFSGALGAAFFDETKRFAAILTFAVTASGLSLAGIGSAFWGLAAGLLALGLDRAALTLRPKAA
jgi:hypothetical protein